MPSLEERIAVIEEKQERQSKDISEMLRIIRDHMDKEETDRKEILNLVIELKNKHDRYLGVAGGITLTISALWAALIAFFELLKNGHTQ